MGYIYESMNRAKEAIAASFKNKEVDYQKAFEIIDKRWECQLHRPLHATGFFLNPELYYDNEEEAKSGEVMEGLIRCIGRLVPDQNTQDKIMEQLHLYQEAKGLFGNPMAVRQRKTRSPADWWSSFGGHAPELQKFAIKILSLTCSATGCERNWSVFQQLHTKRRNRLAQKRLNDLVYVKCNRALQQRSQRNKADLIRLTEIDESNEWVMGVMDEENEDNAEVVFDEEDGLTWRVVDKASGASEPAYSTRTSTPHQSKGTGVGCSTFRTPRVPSRNMHELIDEDEGDEEMEEDIGLSGDEGEDLELGIDYDEDSE